MPAGSPGVIAYKTGEKDTGIEITLGGGQSGTSNGPFIVRSAAGGILVASGVLGGFGFNGTSQAVRSVSTTPTTLNQGQGIILVDATAAPITLTLPAANSGVVGGVLFGPILYIKKIDVSANAVTISRAGADTIEGANTMSLAAQWDKVVLAADGVSLWTKF